MARVFEAVGLAVVLLAIALRYVPRATFPDHLSGHQVYVEDELINKDTRKKLLNHMREMKTFMSNVDQAKATGFVPTYEHVGEAVPAVNGTCAHNYLFFNHDRSQCILADRVDVGKHFITTGGLDGMKESYQELLNRISAFSRFTFFKDMDKHPVMKELFESEKFQTAAKSVCPNGETHLDPFQFSFIISVPGQTVAAHLDAPYFWGANRFRFPQWLLVSMVFSNLFKERFIQQIQVVGYLHEWKIEGQDPHAGGDFVYYTNTSHVGTVIAKPGAGTIVDGSKVLHAAKIFHPEVKAPYLSKDKSWELVYVDDDRWELQGDGVTEHTYATSDLRISMVYRARCFKSPEEAQRYADLPVEDMLTLEDILSTLRKDLVARGVTTAAKLAAMPQLDFAFLIMDTYIKYPLPPLELAWVPLNYCVLPRLAPWTAPLFKLIC